MAKKKQSRRRQAIRDADQRPVPAWIWLTVGLVLGLGLAVLLTVTGLMPQPPGADPDRRPVPSPAPAEGREEIAQPAEDEWKPRYDFYTVLPEMEVVVPEAELTERAAGDAEVADDGTVYLIQVGSFREFGDADRMKAQLALLGVIAHVRSVDINGVTWHRVRVGPFDSSRETDRIKRSLQDNSFEAIVLTERS
ncbi:MAG: SPOR domain-containing protein [Pseudomonadota bacterium]